MKDIKIIRFYPLKDGWLRIEAETDHDSFETDLELIDHKVGKVHKIELVQATLETPENSKKSAPKISPRTDTEIIDALEKADLDTAIVNMQDYGPITWIQLTEFLKDKDKWTQYNNIFKDAGFKWVKDGKDSRWERKT